MACIQPGCQSLNCRGHALPSWTRRDCSQGGSSLLSWLRRQGNPLRLGLCLAGWAPETAHSLSVLLHIFVSTTNLSPLPYVRATVASIISSSISLLRGCHLSASLRANVTASPYLAGRADQRIIIATSTVLYCFLISLGIIILEKLCIGPCPQQW